MMLRRLRLLFLVMCVIITMRAADAGTVSWGPVFPITGVSDIDNSGAAVDAVNASNGTLPDVTVNGVTFRSAAPFASSTAVNTTFWTGVNGSFGDAGLDSIADSHSWQGGDPGTATLSLAGLTVGQEYQLQLIGVMDLRTCCSARVYDVDDGAGNFTTGVTLQRGLGQSVIGTFTADADAQTILLRSANELAGNNDPGLSAYALRAIPEPASMTLLQIALGSLLLFRRRTK